MDQVLNRYSIISIVADGYERVAQVVGSANKSLFVHFLEYDEDIESGEQSQKRKVGDFLEGVLSVVLVNTNFKTDEKNRFEQPFEMSPYIQMVVKVVECVDEFSLLASTNLQESLILIKFESQTYYRPGDSVYLDGTLEFLDASDVYSELED